MVSWEALDALSHQLELCGVGPDTRLVVIAAPDVDSARLTRLRTAVGRTGCDALEIRALRTRRAGSPGELVPAVLDHAQIVVTVGDPDYFAELTDARRRPDDLRHLHLANVPEDEFPPHASLRQRVNRTETLLSDAAALVLRDDFGTELSIDMQDCVIHSDHGLVDDDHPHSVFPAGWVGLQPAADRVEGQLVLLPGDGNPGAGALVRSPVRLEITADHITTIDGESADADTVRAQLESASSQAAYGMAALQLGMNPAAPLAAAFDSRLLDADRSRILAGTITVSFGENLVADRPGPAPLHYVLRDRSLYLDDMAIVRHGALDGDLAPDVYEQHTTTRPGLFD